MQSLIECSGPVEAEPPANPQQPEMDTDVCVRCGLRICFAEDVFGGFCLTCWQRDGCPRPPNVPDAGRWPPGYQLQRDPTPTPSDKKFDGMPADMWEEERVRANKKMDEMATEMRAEERERARVRQKMLDHEREHAEERDRWGYLDNSESANVRRREQWGWLDNSESANVRRMHHFAEQFRRDMQRRATYERAREINALDLAPMRSLRAPPHRNQVPQYRLPPCAVAAEEDDPDDKAEEDESEDASEDDEAEEDVPDDKAEEEDECEDASEDDESIYWPVEAQTNLCQGHQCQVENDAMTDESVSATPMAATVPFYVPCQRNVDVNKRRRLTEEGGFEEEIRSGLVTEYHSAGSIAGSIVAETSATDGSYIMMPNWVGGINSDAPYVARGVSLEPHPGYTGPMPWYLDCDTGSTPP